MFRPWKAPLGEEVNLDISLDLRGKLLATVGNRTQRRLELEYEVWKTLWCIYPDSSLIFSLQPKENIRRRDDTVYALIALYEEEPEYVRGYRCQGRAREFDRKTGPVTNDAAWNRYMARMHFIQQEWVLAHMFFDMKGSRAALLGLVERLIDTLTLLHDRLTYATIALHHDLDPEAQRRVEAGMHAMFAAIDEEASERAVIFGRPTMCHMDFYSARYDETLPTKSVQQRLFEMQVYLVINLLFHEEEFKHGLYMYSVSVRHLACPYTLSELPKHQGEKGNLHFWTRELSDEETERIETSMPTREQIGGVVLGETRKLLESGTDVETALLQSYMAASGLLNAAHKLEEAVKSLQLPYDVALQRLQALTARYRIGEKVPFPAQ